MKNNFLKEVFENLSEFLFSKDTFQGILFIVLLFWVFSSILLSICAIIHSLKWLSVYVFASFVFIAYLKYRENDGEDK